MAKIDVLIPVYNRQDFLKECLESIEWQTYTDWRVIFYNDGSTDLSEEIIDEFRIRHPNTVVINSNVNNGVGHARNRLLRACDAPYSAWMDSDDISHPTRFDAQLSLLENSMHDLVQTEMYFFTFPSKWNQTRAKHTVNVSRYTNRDGLNNNMNFATGMFKSGLKKFKFPEKRVREDIEWMALLIDNAIDFGLVQQPLYSCRRHENRLTMLNSKKKL